MLFDYLKSILVNKNDKLPLDEYVPFMITRWLSFTSTGATNALNFTVNQLGNLDKDIHYKILLQIFPKAKSFKTPKYIKKAKKEKDTTSEDIQKLANYMEVSSREIKLMLAIQNSITK